MLGGIAHNGDRQVQIAQWNQLIQKFFETAIESNDLRKPAEFEWTCWKRFEFRLEGKVKGIVDCLAVDLWIESLVGRLDQWGSRCHRLEVGYADVFKSSDLLGFARILGEFASVKIFSVE